MIGMHIPAIQSYGKNVDYGIGSCLFTMAVVLFSLLVLRLIRLKAPALRPRDEPACGASLLTLPRICLRLIACAAMVAAGSLAYAHPIQSHMLRARNGKQDLEAMFPERAGGFTRMRTWKQYDNDGTTVIYDWAEFRNGAGGDVVQVGISPVLGAHDAVLCHVTRDEQFLWRGTEDLATADSNRVGFSAFFNDDGLSQTFQLGTICGPSQVWRVGGGIHRFPDCGQPTSPGGLLDRCRGGRLPVVIRAESADTSLAPERPGSSSRAINQFRDEP